MKLTVPKKALRLPVYGGPVSEDGEEQGVTPEVNDPVSFTVEGVVTAVKGEDAEVEVRFVNGERPGAAKAKKAKDDPTDADLEKMAESADANEA